MGCGGGVDHQALHVCHVGQQGEDLQVVDKRPGRFLPAPDLKGENGTAAPGEVPLVQRVVRMFRQGGMVHLLHQRMVLQVLHHLRGVFRVPVQPQAQGFHPLQQEEGVEG